MSEDSNRNLRFEKVHIIGDYWDGPISGIADYFGIPHHYERVFDEEGQKFSDYFIITPIDSQTFKLALEEQEIWRRWDSEYAQGKVSLETHPALPRDRDRYEQIREKMASSLKTNTEKAFRAKGRFETSMSDNQHLRSRAEWHVSWTPS